eukprot:TRINITY_DN104173_c0_g1_i1.p1 TRINITY_DN104173_c0_g1~~TRINITY_DN104173_c0_g1_i1.p1  ORF type:complete len:264 (+),score=62.52 TRINITY_DN104173_c0_g1_i1:56-793(+)
MSRELEAIRHVIVKDVSRFKQLWNEKKEAIAAASSVFESSKASNPQAARTSTTEASRIEEDEVQKQKLSGIQGTQLPISFITLDQHRCALPAERNNFELEWRISWGSTEASSPPVAMESFEIPEFVGASFCCSFGPADEERAQGASSFWYFRFAASGAPPEASRSVWRVNCRLELESEEVSSSTDSLELIKELRGCRLRLGESLRCKGSWPSERIKRYSALRITICLELKGVSQEVIHTKKAWPR